MRVFLTGATGFIGKALVVELLNKGFNVSIAVRNKVDIFPSDVRQFVMGNFNDNSNFLQALDGADYVVHLAGMAHTIGKANHLPLDELRKINVDLTMSIFRQAAKAGVKRLIFLSSIGVNGNRNHSPFLEGDAPNPQEPYAISKHKAELNLLKMAKDSDLEVVIIRPPLVYGINAPGNFGRLINWIKAKHPMPLPLGAIHNKRSFVSLDNLVDFIITCMLHKKAANEIFLISDGQDLSVTELLKKLTSVFNKKVLLLPVPVGWMVLVAKLLGKEADAVRLFFSLTVDSSKARNLLDWHPVTTMDEQLCKIAENEKNI